MNELIFSDPAICSGKPCITGTRIMVASVMDFVRVGKTHAEIIAEYPDLSHEQINAAIAYWTD